MALDQEFSGTFSSLVPPGGRTPTTAAPTTTPHGLDVHIYGTTKYFIGCCLLWLCHHAHIVGKDGVLQFVSDGILFLVLI